MRTAQISQYGPIDVIEFVDLPIPEPGAGQLRVKVKAAGVGPWDALVREGRSGAPQSLPLTLGSDVAGIVDAIGPKVVAFREADEVYGLTNEHFTGGYAEYALVSAASMALKPKALTFVEAASVPVVAVTAWQMLFDFARVSAGQKVLILGAAGNVGAYAVQLARNAGLDVTATASTTDLEYVRELGATTVVDYRQATIEDSASRVDAVIDTVGGPMRERSISLIRRGGILVSAVYSPMPNEAAARAGVRAVSFIVDVTAETLNFVSKLFDSGKLRPQVGTVLPLEEARLAHQMLAGAPHARGKIVLNIAA